MRSVKQLFLGLLCLSFILTGCSGKNVIPMDDYESTALGIVLEKPETWIVEEAEGALYLATIQEALDNQALEDEAAISISTSTTFNFNDTEDPVAIVNEFINRFQSTGEGLVITQEAAALTIQGQPAAQAVFNGAIADQAGFFTLSAIVDDGNVIVLFSIDGSSDNRYAEVIQQVTNSLQFK
ncbi:MAG TPA: hypothetical protein PKM21_03300 [Anaerolineales bacterium]|nr:hypothetical protein [Anaerolineales bacterium]